MKKLLALLVFALMVTGMAAAAESPLYAKVVSIDKIYSDQKGYKITYYNIHGDLETIYVPLDWFYKLSPYLTEEGFVKAEIIRGFGDSYPYLQIFWKNGKFHHLRIFAVDNYSDRSWGVPDDRDNLAPHFDPTKAPDFKF